MAARKTAGLARHLWPVEALHDCMNACHTLASEAGPVQEQAAASPVQSKVLRSGSQCCLQALLKQELAHRLPLSRFAG